MLSGLGGLSVPDVTLESKARVPIVVLTGRDGTNSIVLGLDLGADDYLTKQILM